MVHGGGACRAMYRPYAEYLSKLGYQSILEDLPGHGSYALMDKDENPLATLTLDNCVCVVESVLKENNLSRNKTIYVGGSLGGYIGFYILEKLKDSFCGAVLIDVGQNVGPDCSVKAKFGLWFLRILCNNMSNERLMKAMLSVSQKSPVDWKLVESTFGAGIFFDQGAAQVHCLHRIPSRSYPNK
jgi:pimeloyl-ACP methyl ester carboxylesterase